MATTNNKEKRVSRTCSFCVNNVKEVDYKDTDVLKRYISSYGKIVPTRRSGVCSKHQKKLSNAIKKARIMGLLPFLVQ